MSHEIRTPLTGIIGYAELLQENPEELEEFATHIAASGQRLLRTLNAVLELSKLEAGEWAPEEEAVDLRAIADQAGKALASKAHEKDLSFQIEHENDQILALTERKAAERIAENLLHNAVKFTTGGEVRIRTGYDEGHPFLAIRDTGIGISKDMQEKVLEAFTQESNGLNRSYEGAGLGLTISHKLARRMNAQFQLESARNEGTEVRIVFPPAVTDQNGQPASDRET